MRENGVALLTVLFLAGCTLPDQTRVPPNVRLSANSGPVEAVVDQTTGRDLFLTDPNAPIDFTAEGFSSLVGLSRVELHFNLQIGCWVSDTNLRTANVSLPVVVATWS